MRQKRWSRTMVSIPAPAAPRARQAMFGGALRPPTYRGQLGLFLDFAPHLGLQDVPDPYYGGTLHFERVLDLIEQASDALVAHLFLRHKTA